VPKVPEDLFVSKVLPAVQCGMVVLLLAFESCEDRQLEIGLVGSQGHLGTLVVIQTAVQCAITCKHLSKGCEWRILARICMHAASCWACLGQRWACCEPRLAAPRSWWADNSEAVRTRQVLIRKSDQIASQATDNEWEGAPPAPDFTCHPPLHHYSTKRLAASSNSHGYELNVEESKYKNRECSVT
jgi:hypothetical protein